MRQHLQSSMLDGPSPIDAAATLSEYHSMGQKELMKKNYTVARRWWNKFNDYCKHIGSLKVDPHVRGELFKPENEDLWVLLWNEYKMMYFHGKVGVAQSYLHELRYRDAVMVVKNVRDEPFDLFHSLDPLLQAKFHLCEALGCTAIGYIERGRNSLVSAVSLFHSSVASTAPMTRQMMEGNLQDSINLELKRMNLPHRCNLPGRPVGNSSRSFWEWLEFPEE